MPEKYCILPVHLYLLCICTWIRFVFVNTYRCNTSVLLLYLYLIKTDLLSAVKVLHPNTSSRCICRWRAEPIFVPNKFFAFNRFRFCIPPVVQPLAQFLGALHNRWICFATDYLHIAGICCTHRVYSLMAEQFPMANNIKDKYLYLYLQSCEMLCK